MLVIADATPLNILVRTGLVDVLARLYGEIIVPPAVLRELSYPRTPPTIRDWIASGLPPWIQVRSPAVEEPLSPGAGEREAIRLAEELDADLLLMDDKRARRAASAIGIAVVGTIGVVELAAQRDLIDLNDAMQRIRQTDFFVSDQLIHSVLERAKQNRRTR